MVQDEMENNKNYNHHENHFTERFYSNFDNYPTINCIIAEEGVQDCE